MIKTDIAKCLRCSGCVGVCPKSALTLTEHGIVCDGRCISCGTCVNFCPVGAINLLENEGVTKTQGDRSRLQAMRRLPTEMGEKK